jgi:nucleoside 2-deoxyribosyltransferase
MNVYFAGPLFSKAEKQFNQELTDKLETAGFEVFLPQRDGVTSNKPPHDKMSREERRQTMFNLDKEKIFKSDIFLFILDGRVPDEGACVELGIAYCQKELQGRKKLLVGLKTDSRAVQIMTELNPMLKVPLDYIAKTEEELIEFLKKYKVSTHRKA